MSVSALEKTIEKTKKQMKAAAKELDFIEAARLRDEMFAFEQLLKEKKQKTN
jgi:excinuclease ABC subunit B